MAKKKSGSETVRSGARKRPRADVSRESGANPTRTLVLRKPGGGRKSK